MKVDGFRIPFLAGGKTKDLPPYLRHPKMNVDRNFQDHQKSTHKFDHMSLGSLRSPSQEILLLIKESKKSHQKSCGSQDNLDLLGCICLMKESKNPQPIDKFSRTLDTFFFIILLTSFT